MSRSPRPSVRVVATVPAGIHDRLVAIAAKEDRAPGNLAGYILEEWVRAQERKQPA